jgi:hypothetical protein
VTPEMWLGMVFAIASIATALVEQRRHSAELGLAQRIVALEHRLEWLEERLKDARDRVNDLESAARQDPNRKPA